MSRLHLSTFTLAILLSSGLAHAGGTKTFVIDDFESMDKGEINGAAVENSGRITVGVETQAAEVPGVSIFTCAASGKNAWVGTSEPAAVHKVSLGADGKPHVKPLASLDGVLVSALVAVGGGNVLAATLPGGKIVKIDAKGKVSPFAELAVQQIWSLVVFRDRLWVGTGPNGELWSMGLDGGNHKLALNVDEADILAIQPVGRSLLVGTSPKARLYLVGDKPEGVLLHEFSGDEVRGLALSDTFLYAAVNDFEDRGLSSLDSLEKQLARASVTGKSPPSSGEPEAPKANAKLWRVDLSKRGSRDALDPQRAADAAWETLLDRSKQYFTDLLPADRGSVLLSASVEGKIYRVRGRRDVATVADLEERQATGLCELDGGRRIATSGDGARVYNIQGARATKALWTSDVLDAKQPADFGRVIVRGISPITARIRTGPNDDPGPRWSAWRSVELTRNADTWEGRVQTDRRRYAQIEIGLGAPASELRDLTVFYAPENLPPLLTEVDLEAPEFTPADPGEPKSEAKIKWKADARDDDDLIYEVKIRPEGSGTDGWIALHDEPTDKKELDFDLSTMPDGVYEIGVVASDEPDNGSARAKTDELISAPFVVDRTRPTLDNTKLTAGIVAGIARDGSRIHDVAFSLDGGAFRQASPGDGMFDGPSEPFEIRLPKDLETGSHRVVVRARDEHGNTSRIAITWKK